MGVTVRQKQPEGYMRQKRYSALRQVPDFTLVAGTGFEPVTFGLWARRATKLLHPAVVEIY